jgi:endonuclease/exonuclease/phosphatase family metal-dependent hydrolase
MSTMPQAKLEPDASPGQRLRLLSYNVQAGIATSRYRHYLTHSWKHVLHHPQRFHNLDRMAQVLQEFDIVGLQEVDAGSRRSGFINLTEYLAERAGFPFWDDKTNRRLGRFARHSMGVLSRFRPTEIIEHRLPGRIPGRGALAVRFGRRDASLVVMIVHLALSRRARMLQLEYLSELVNEHRNVVLMGDMNCRSDSEEIDLLIDRTMMREPTHGLHTFPSWRPQRNIDHILVTPTVQVSRADVLDHPVSDHLPIAMEIVLPDAIHLAE